MKWLLTFFLRQGLALSPRLKCSGATQLTAASTFQDQAILLPQHPQQEAGITGVHDHTQLIFVFFVEMGLHHVAQAGLKLLSSSDPLALASQSAGITGMSHSTQLVHCYMYFKIQILER